MLNPRLRDGRTLLWLALFLAGCCQSQDRIETQEVWRSEVQSLEIKNGTTEDLRLVPGGDAGGEARPLPQGGTAIVRFIAIRETEHEVPDEGGPSSRLEGSTRQSLASADEAHLLFFADGDYGITIEFPGDVRHRFIVEPCTAWFESPPGTGGKTIEITGPPLAGIPANVCP